MNITSVHSMLMQDAYCSDLARELHDFLGQKLFVANLLVEKSSLQASERHIKKMLVDANKKLNKTIAAIRELSQTMNSLQLNNAFFYITLENLFLLFEQASDLEIDFKRFHIPNELTDKAKEQLYRIIQEALTNTAKHAQASKLIVILSQKKEKLYIKCMDDGQGIDLKTLKLGSGLYNIKQRVESLGGAVKFSSSVGHYFQIYISLPAEYIYKTEGTPAINVKSN